MAETTTRTSALDFFGEVVEQVKKITWPDQAQLKSSTGMIVVFMLVMASIIFVMDRGVGLVLDMISSLFTS
ncbi:preprotein translocase subunit SecE [Longimicrobium sp.]|jgi:preprotein translocase SecE subunit|uniref:preprotein translocase subunit SecE n=1 Tax=Longimicrobium sp. TaxID=2029185 RepID=UPI002ED95A23